MKARLLTFAAVLGLTLAGAAQAGQAVTLKAETLDADGVVTLGDLFEGAGLAADVRVAAKPGLSIVLDAGAVQQVARRAGLDWANTQGIRRIVVRSGASGGSAAATTQRGNVEVLTYARSLSAGEIVQPEDLVWAKLAVAPGDAPNDAAEIIGLEARRPLRAGSAVSSRDVSAPQVIASGDLITLTYQADGMALTVKAKAKGRATVGEAFEAENLTSKRTVLAVATAPGQAAVGPNADVFMANPTLRYAQR